MKRRILALFLAALTLVTLTTAAFADGEAYGAYSVRSKTGYTLRVENVTEDGGFYPEADTFTLTFQTELTEQTLVYLVEGADTLPTEENLQYIDQSGSGTVLTLKPKTLEAGKTYRVYVSTTSKAPTEAGSFSYGAKPQYKRGDANNDGLVDTSDAVSILLYIVSKVQFTETQKLAADANRDQKIDTSDAVAVLLHIVGKYSLD